MRNLNWLGIFMLVMAAFELVIGFVWAAQDDAVMSGILSVHATVWLIGAFVIFYVGDMFKALNTKLDAISQRSMV